MSWSLEAWHLQIKKQAVACFSPKELDVYCPVYPSIVLCDGLIRKGSLSALLHPGSDFDWLIPRDVTVGYSRNSFLTESLG